MLSTAAEQTMLLLIQFSRPISRTVADSTKLSKETTWRTATLSMQPLQQENTHRCVQIWKRAEIKLSAWMYATKNVRSEKISNRSMVTHSLTCSFMTSPRTPSRFRRLVTLSVIAACRCTMLHGSLLPLSCVCCALAIGIVPRPAARLDLWNRASIWCWERRNKRGSQTSAPLFLFLAGYHLSAKLSQNAQIYLPLTIRNIISPFQ